MFASNRKRTRSHSHSHTATASAAVCSGRLARSSAFNYRNRMRKLLIFATVWVTCFSLLLISRRRQNQNIPRNRELAMLTVLVLLFGLTTISSMRSPFVRTESKEKKCLYLVQIKVQWREIDVFAMRSRRHIIFLGMWLFTFIFVRCDYPLLPALRGSFCFSAGCFPDFFCI